MKQWHLFISHASEDKQAVALPLADTLIRAGLKVWLDRFELKLGDSLRERIDEGLSESAFGVVILSEHFLNKGWPKKELNGLFALEEDEVKIILPIWHGVDKAAVARFSPILADRLAVNTENGIPRLAQQIAQVVLRDGARRGSPRGTLAGQFVDILRKGPDPANMSTFLTIYPQVLERATGHFGFGEALFQERPDFGDFSPDLAVGKMWKTSGTWLWRHFYFCPVKGPFFKRRQASGALKAVLQSLERLRHWLTENRSEAARRLLASISTFQEHSAAHHGHAGTILVGRRDDFSKGDRKAIESLNCPGTEVRTYDWLIEACAVLDTEHSAPKPRN